MAEIPHLIDSRIELNDGVAILQSDRDDVRNALTGTALIDDIVRTVDWANVSADVSVLVMTGTGTAFSAGGNIKDMQARRGDFAGDVAEVEGHYRQCIQRIPLALQAAEVPVIAAVNGPAIGDVPQSGHYSGRRGCLAPSEVDRLSARCRSYLYGTDDRRGSGAIHGLAARSHRARRVDIARC